MNSRITDVSRLAVLQTVIAVVAAFFITSLLFTPGYVDLTAPAHSDLYRYFLIAEAPWTASTWLTPRPLMVAYLKIAGVLHTPGSLYILLALPSIAFVTMLALIGRRLSAVPLSTVSIFLFGVAVFGMPHFVPMFQYDYGGMLSGFLAAMAVYLVLPRTDQATSPRMWAWAMVLVWASLETKPTYGLALFGLSAAAAVLIRSRTYLLATVGVALILAAVFVKDVLLGSGFIQSASTNNVYSVVIDIPRNVHALWFYMKNAFTPTLLAAVVICALPLLITRRWKLGLFIVVAAVGGSAPMALLVNRQWDIYAWFSSVIFAMTILMGSAVLIHHGARTSVLRHVVGYVVLAIAAALVLVNAGSRSAAAEWASNNQIYNRHILDTLSAVGAQGEGRILFAGSKGPYQPLRNTEFVKRVYPSLYSFDVLARKDELPWNKMASREFVNAVYLSELNLATYDRVYVLSDKGHLAGVYSAASLLEMPQYERNRILLCSEDATSNMVANASQLLKALECLVTAEEYLDAVTLGESHRGLTENQPWIFFQVAKAYGGSGRNDMARQAIDHALTLEPENQVFKNLRQQFAN